jgi:hypothetical protein
MRLRAAWPFDLWLRGVMIVGGLALISLLIVARGLEPSATGMGTHQQLGLPPCSSQMMFGLRCPACGMTTSWSYFTRGNLLASLAVNSGGTMLALASLVCGPWLLASGLRGRWVGRPPHELVILGICITVVLVIVTDWLLRLTVL